MDGFKVVGSVLIGFSLVKLLEATPAWSSSQILIGFVKMFAVLWVALYLLPFDFFDDRIKSKIWRTVTYSIIFGGVGLLAHFFLSPTDLSVMFAGIILYHIGQLFERHS